MVRERYRLRLDEINNIYPSPRLIVGTMFKIYPQTPLRYISKRPPQWGLIKYTRNVRFFQASALSLAKQMPPRPTIDESEITGTYLKGSGPGGQKIVSQSFTPRSLIAPHKLAHSPIGVYMISKMAL